MAKASREKEPFTPVVLTLESKEEIASLCAACAHSAIVRAAPHLSEIEEALRPYKTKKTYREVYNSLCSNLYGR